MSDFRGSQVQQGKGAASAAMPSQQQLTGSQIHGARSANFPSHFDLLSPTRAMGTFNSSEPPVSPPDAMDLARPDFETRNSGTCQSSLRSVRPQQQASMGQKSTDSFSERLMAVQSPVTGSNPVLLEKRFPPSSSSVPPISGNPPSVQDSSSLGNSSQQPSDSSITSPPAKSNSETSKLTPQELERIRINRASEYYRLQREKFNEMNRCDAKEDQRQSSLSPSSPPTRPTHRTSAKTSNTTAALRASRIIKNRNPPNAVDELSQTNVQQGAVQTRSEFVLRA